MWVCSRKKSFIVLDPAGKVQQRRKNKTETSAVRKSWRVLPLEYWRWNYTFIKCY